MTRTLAEANKEILRLKKLLSSHELKQLEADEKILKRNVELADMVNRLKVFLLNEVVRLCRENPCPRCSIIREAEKLLRANK